MTGDWRVLAPDIRCEVGEGPLWVEREDALYWVDIMAPAVHRVDLVSGAAASWTMPEPVGFIAARSGRPGFIVGLASGLAAFETEPFSLTPLMDLEPDRPENRLNDATVDLQGRLWVGTMLPDGSRPVGALYRVDDLDTFERVDDGYFVPNGPTFSPGGVLYHADSARRLVYRYDAAGDGQLGSRSEHLRFPVDEGLPDGMTIDRDGCLWVAHWDGGRLSRFAPDGSRVLTVPLPVSRVTSCAFGGVDGDRLFVTSAALSRDEEQFAGAVFEVEVDAAGWPTPGFAG